MENPTSIKRLLGDVSLQLKPKTICKYQSMPTPKKKKRSVIAHRSIAVGENYVSYVLDGMNIEIIKKSDTSLKCFFIGHTERVTDMAFQTVQTPKGRIELLASVSLDGKIFIWNTITSLILVDLQILGVDGLNHPRLCWYNEILLGVSIGKYVLVIQTSKVEKGKPIKFSIDGVLVGVNIMGTHDGEVTDLSVSKTSFQGVVSSSLDGEVKIWSDFNGKLVSVLKPHGGDPVHSVSYIKSPTKGNMLITGGPLNRELKIWIPEENASWRCIQTFDLNSSSEPRAEETFFNHVIALSEAGLILLASAKTNAIYAVRLDYGSSPVDTRMVSFSKFTVTMAILSFIGTYDPPGNPIVTVYCVETNALQQYTFDLCLCPPPPIEIVLARVQEDLVKNEKALLDSTLKMMEKRITEVMTPFEERFNKEVVINNSLMQETVSSAIKEFVQTGISDQAFTQLEHSMSKAIQDQYQTFGKQAIQESLKLELKSSVIPSLERSCQAMLDQLKDGIEEHTSVDYQKFLSTLEEIRGCAVYLAEAIRPLVVQVEDHSDKKKKIESLISESKYEESFTLALERSDASLVSWLCSKLDIHKLDMSLRSQAELLTLLHHLTYDISKDTAFKLAWIDGVVAAIEPFHEHNVANGPKIYDEVLGTLSVVESNDNRAKYTMQHLRKYMRMSRLHRS